MSLEWISITHNALTLARKILDISLRDIIWSVVKIWFCFLRSFFKGFFSPMMSHRQSVRVQSEVHWIYIIIQKKEMTCQINMFKKNCKYNLANYLTASDAQLSRPIINPHLSLITTLSECSTSKYQLLKYILYLLTFLYYFTSTIYPTIFPSSVHYLKEFINIVLPL